MPPSIATGTAWAVAGAVPGWALLSMAGVMGLVIGSFANVVVYRTPRHMSVVSPPSFCPRCTAPVTALDNVPVVSWILLGGRCRNCGEPISARYPLVEAGTGALFVLVAAASGPRWSAFGLCALAATLGVSAVIELDGQVPPRSVNLAGVALGLVGLAAAAGAEDHWARLLGAMIGTVVAGALSPATARWAGRTRRSGEAWWALVPAGAVLGWSGPVGAATGTLVLGVAALVLPGRRLIPPADDGGPDDRASTTSSATRAGPAVAAAVGAAVAVVAALVAGSSLG